MAELWTEVISISESKETTPQQMPVSVQEIKQYESSEEVTHTEDTMLSTRDEKVIEADRFRGLPVSYKRVVFKTLGISILWIVIASLLFGGLFFDNGYYPIGVIATLAFAQLPFILSLSIINTLRMRRRKVLPWPAEDSGWSRLRKLLTFPDHVFDNQKTIFLRFDILVTFCVAVIILLANLTIALPVGIILFSMIFVGLAVLRFAFLNHRWNNPESERYNKREFVTTFLLSISGNILFINSLSNHWRLFSWGMSSHGFYIFSGIMLSILLYYSWYLLYSLVARGSTLWREDHSLKVIPADSKHESPTTKDRSSLLNTLGTRFRQTISRILGWYILIGAISGLILLFTTGLNTDILNISFIMGYWVPILGINFISSIALVTLQLTYRRYLIKSGKSEQVIGERGRVQAFLDLMITGSLLLYLLSFWSSRMYSYIDTIQFYISINFASTFFLLQVSVLIAVIFLWGALMGRLFSNLADITSPGCVTGTRLVIISGIMLAISTGIFMGYSLLLLSVRYGTLLPIEILSQLVLLVFAVVQIVTSQMKQSQKEEPEKIEVEVEQALEEETESNGPPIIESS